MAEKCTMCGKEFDMWDEQANFCTDKLITYGSIHDMEHFHINLCCDCFDKVMEMIAPLCAESPFSEVCND